MTPRRTRPAGFTLVEVLVAIAVIAALAAVSVPVGSFALKRARSTACLAKLRGIGAALEAYLQDHNDLMPELDAGRGSRDEDLPVLDNTLDRYVESLDTFHCPADPGEFARSGSSYLWNSTQSGRHRLKLAFFGVERDPHGIPLVTDKEAWHPAGDGINVLYADYHISNKLEFRAGAR